MSWRQKSAPNYRLSPAPSSFAADYFVARGRLFSACYWLVTWRKERDGRPTSVAFRVTLANAQKNRDYQMMNDCGISNFVFPCTRHYGIPLSEIGRDTVIEKKGHRCENGWKCNISRRFTAAFSEFNPLLTKITPFGMITSRWGQGITRFPYQKD